MMLFSHQPKNRWSAFYIHLCLSFILLLAITSVIYFIWYPRALMFASDALAGMKIVIIVDMILGPSLTLIVYNTNKASNVLLRDLAIIATFQLSCLSAGLFLVYQERPLAVVYKEKGNYFQIYNHQNFKISQIDISALEKIPGSYPKLVIENAPSKSKKTDINDVVKYYIDNALGKIHLDLYTTLKDQKPNQIKDAINASNAEKRIDCIDRPIQFFTKKGVICFNPHSLNFSNYRATAGNTGDGPTN